MKILLCCGAGMSSGFLAQKVRGAAKKAGDTQTTCEAHASSTIDPLLSGVDIVCLGPHLKSDYEAFVKKCESFGTKCIMIPSSVYSMFDGAKLYQLCKETVEES